jgi:hypothetical protein
LLDLLSGRLVDELLLEGFGARLTGRFAGGFKTSNNALARFEY